MVRRVREQVPFDARGTNMELWVRGMTIEGGRGQGIAVGARDRVLKAGKERPRTLSLRMLVEAGVQSGRVVADAKQMIAAALELAVSKIIKDQHAVPWIVSLALLLTSSEAQFTASDPTTL